MRSLLTIGAALFLAASIGISPAPAAPGDSYKAKKAECKARAKSMNFGVHFIKRNRWVDDCIAGRHHA